MKYLNERLTEKMAELEAARGKYNRMMLALRVERFHVEHLETEWRQLRREVASEELAAMRMEMGF